jgi:hypothetical protein
MLFTDLFRSRKYLVAIGPVLLLIFDPHFCCSHNRSGNVVETVHFEVVDGLQFCQTFLLLWCEEQALGFVRNSLVVLRVGVGSPFASCPARDSATRSSAGAAKATIIDN